MGPVWAVAPAPVLPLLGLGSAGTHQWGWTLPHWASSRVARDCSPHPASSRPSKVGCGGGWGWQARVPHPHTGPRLDRPAPTSVVLGWRTTLATPHPGPPSSAGSKGPGHRETRPGPLICWALGRKGAPPPVGDRHGYLGQTGSHKEHTCRPLGPPGHTRLREAARTRLPCPGRAPEAGRWVWVGPSSVTP